MLGARQQLRHALELRLRGLGRLGAIALRGQQAEGRLIPRRVHHRRGHLELDGPRTPAPHLAEGQSGHLRDALPGQDRSAPLDAGSEGIELILTLEGGRRRRIDDAEPVLRGDRDEGHTFVSRRDDAREQVRRPGARVAEHGAHGAGGLVEALRHVRARRLVAHGHEADLVALQRRQQRIDLGAGQTEDEAHALEGQTASQDLSTALVGHLFTSSVGSLEPSYLEWVAAPTSKPRTGCGGSPQAPRGLGRDGSPAGVEGDGVAPR
jgi:hypothetical protein